MTKGYSWKNVRGAAYLGDGLPVEIVLHFKSSGVYEPARLSGPPEDCNPEYRSEERIPDYAEFIVYTDSKDWTKRIFVRVDVKTAEALFDAFDQEIQDAPLEFPEYDPPDED